MVKAEMKKNIINPKEQNMSFPTITITIDF